MTTLDVFLKSVLDEGKSDNVPEPENCKNLSVETIATAITSQVNNCKDDGNISNKAFYAGICKDVKDNMQRHGNDSYVALVDCGTREKSGAVEKKLKEYGFDVGKRADNGGDDDSTIVYVIKKDSNFKR